METFLTVIHWIVCLFMILVVLIQGGNQGGVSAAFGGGNSSGVFGATGATSLLGKLTYGAAAVFMTTSICLSVIQGKSGSIGLQDRLKKAAPIEQKTEAPVAPTAAPAPATP